MKTLRLILGDQLNSLHSWFNIKNPDKVYVMMEIKPETEYVLHHGQKILAIFSSMRNFAKEIEQQGHYVHYIHFDDEENTHSFENNLLWLIEKYRIELFEYQEPDEYRLDKQINDFIRTLHIETKVYSTEHFYTQRGDLKNFFAGKKSWLMETFYRHMRRKHHILMEEGKPVGGNWNFDKANRNKLPSKHIPPEPKSFGKPHPEVKQYLLDDKINYFGEIDSSFFTWPLSRNESIELLDYFVDSLLPYFGTYQDAMSERSWSLYHSRLSFSLNVKMLSPQEVIQKVLQNYQDTDDVDIAQAEGFIRQILGWREFMRGIYWAFMPKYAQKNHFNHQRKLPKFYWDGKTNMNCMKHSINQSLQYAYAHHIQRLMITGNFALLNETHPDETDWWYLGIYIDAFEWVEMPNARGMSQFADGGVLATKPYISSANYINKMSDYCQSCSYDKSKTTGEKACPFNSMFWSFVDKNREELRKNRRMGFVLSNWDKRTPESKSEVLEQAEYYKKHVDSL